MPDDCIRTTLGRLRVRQEGVGPVVVFWHSLFVDSRSWELVVRQLAPHRTLVMIDGPGHGRSDPIGRDFTFDECTGAAVDVLDGLGLEAPVDWVGNAWGGHVGILLAATHPDRVASVATINTPVPALTLKFRITQAWPLVALYRVAGPIRFLCNALAQSLVGEAAADAQPDLASATMAAFREADRMGMYHAMRSMMLKRPSVSDRLPDVAAPTLMFAARDDDEGWPLHEAEAACARMPNARAAEVCGSPRVAPLLRDADRIARTLLDFWADAH